MNQATNQVNRVETQLVFTADASKANAELKKLQDQTKQVDRAAEEAKKRLSQLGGAGQAAQGYGLAAPMGGSIAMANAQAMAQGGAFPTYQAGANPFRTNPMMGGGGFGGGGGGAGGNDQAKMGEFFAALGKAAAVVTIFATALDAAGKSVRRDGSYFGAGNTLLTDDERRNRNRQNNIADIPIIGGLARRAANGLDSLVYQDSMQRNDFVSDVARQRLMRQPLEFERDNALRGLDRQRMGRNLSDSYGAEFAMNEMERANAQGMMGAVFRISDRNMNPAERDAKFAVRQAAMGVRMQGAMYNQAVGRRELIQEDLRVAMNRANRNGVDRGVISEASTSSWSTAANAAGTAQALRGQVNFNEVQQLQDRLRQSLEEEKTMLEQLTQKKLEASRASANLQKVQLEMAKQELQIRNGQASSFGMKSGSDRQLIADAFGRFKELGFGGLSEDDRSLLGSDPLTSETIRRAAIESARSDPRFSGLVNAQGMASFGELERRVSVQNKIEVELLTDEVTLRRELADASDKLLKIFKDEITRAFETKFKVQDLKVLEQQTVQNIE